ncbi:hypothetical protein TNCV_4924751 [Trichonephila clavipes]|nr:hypothetical protein TNCV_4924751 [Trichonephila clavipes]
MRNVKIEFKLQKNLIELAGVGHFARACRDKSLNNRNSKNNKFSLTVKAQSKVVQAEDATKNIFTAETDTSESMFNFLVENVDKLKVEEEARLKAEEEAKAVEEGRKMEEE